ncbi:ABC transporter C-terminal domain-containing protein [Halostagnicola kamekurae]|uniref:Uncharacterized protein n=1 Tax=Halostagnicola kamekurae TaxID=619731 RepID=A0A1I6RUQ6_9EURY|nr:ABC transporter C-terminal domain-containing protein [Halostagnicola kamekurae]SFS68178.1 hypothetical protein SAMN04488556_2119 [Halostagnicola kamekurae]
MSGSRGILIVVLIAVVGLAIAPLATAGFADPFDGPTNAFDAGIDGGTGDHPAPSTDGNAAQADTQAAENGDSPGTNVSTFMQSTAVETETAVDIGIFNASYENADGDAREAIVTQRVDTLEDRVAELEAERDRLQSNEDELHPVVYDARMTRLAAQISSLEESVAIAEQRTMDIDLDLPVLEDLRSSVTSLRTPDITAAADGLIGVDFSDPVPENLKEQVNESTPDIGDIDPDNVTNESTVLSVAENETSLADSAVNATAVTGGSTNATDGTNVSVTPSNITMNATDTTGVISDSMNATDLGDGTLNVTDGTLPAGNETGEESRLNWTTNETVVVDYPSSELE